MRFGFVLLGAVFLLGCGESHPPVYPVTGVVTYNGQPVAEAEVVFLPQGEAAATAPSGTTDAAGRYALTTFFSAESQVIGAQPGSYKVTVTKWEIPSGIVDPYKKDTPQPKHLLPEKFSLPQQTPFTATVETKSNNIPLDLKD